MLTEAGVLTVTTKRKFLRKHLFEKHGVVVHPCQMSPKNLCTRKQGSVLTLIEIKKFLAGPPGSACPGPR